MAKRTLSKVQQDVLRLGNILFRVAGAAGNLRSLNMNNCPVFAVNSVLAAIGCLETAISELRAWNLEQHKKRKNR